MSDVLGTRKNQAEQADSSIFFRTCIIASVAKVREVPISAGYEPWLISKGIPPIVARLMAALIVKHGRRLAADCAREPLVVESLRVLCDPAAGRLAKRRRVEILIRAWEETNIIETIFDHAAVNVCHFAEQLKACANRNFNDFSTPAWLAEQAIAAWRPRRGPKVTEASAAHKFFLSYVVRDLEQDRAYTRDPVADDFVDDLTRATRMEFGEPNFNPQSSRRRIVRGPQPFEVQ